MTPLIVSNFSRIVIALILLLMPLVLLTGYVVMYFTRKNNMFTPLQVSFIRATHGHAAVLSILSIICQLLIDLLPSQDGLAWYVRIGAMISPLLIIAGTVFGLPDETGKPRRLYILVTVGAVGLGVSLVALAVGLLLIDFMS